MLPLRRLVRADIDDRTLHARGAVDIEWQHLAGVVITVQVEHIDRQIGVATVVLARRSRLQFQIQGARHGAREQRILVDVAIGTEPTPLHVGGTDGAGGAAIVEYLVALHEGRIAPENAIEKGRTTGIIVDGSAGTRSATIAVKRAARDRQLTCGVSTIVQGSAAHAATIRRELSVHE